MRKRDKEIQSVPKTSCFCSQRQNKRSHETKKNFLLLEGKNALYGQVFCTVVTKRFGVFQKHLVFVLNFKMKDCIRPKEFSFARREERPLRPSFLHSRDKEIRRFPKTSCFYSQRQNKRSHENKRIFFCSKGRLPSQHKFFTGLHQRRSGRYKHMFFRFSTLKFKKVKVAF